MTAVNERTESTAGTPGTGVPYIASECCDAASYAIWREEKLAWWPASTAELVVEIGGLLDVDAAAAVALRKRIRNTNMAIYACRDRSVDRAAIRGFAAHFGLSRLDRHLCADEGGITALELTDAARRNTYIPYSNRTLGWHTDGYYNSEADRIRAVILHCARDAAEGGENALLDPEIAYIKLRDADPEFVSALTHPRCMTIPANVQNGREIRPSRSGPVFSFDDTTGALHMRFTARKKYVIWRDDAATHAAVAYLNRLLADEDGPILRHRLRPGQGIISNNVLHKRSGFTNGPAHERLVYRARYFDRL